MSRIHSLADLERENILAAWWFSRSMTTEQFEQLCLVTAARLRRDLSDDVPAAA